MLSRLLECKPLATHLKEENQKLRALGERPLRRSVSTHGHFGPFDEIRRSSDAGTSAALGLAAQFTLHDRRVVRRLGLHGSGNARRLFGVLQSGRHLSLIGGQFAHLIVRNA